MSRSSATPPESKEVLATLERLIVRDAVSPHAALQAAYQLGVVDGQLQMAAVGIEAVTKLAEAA